MLKGAMLVIAGSLFLGGCGNMEDTASKPSTPAKSKPPYHLEFDTHAPKPNPAGVALPAINYTASSSALERRAVLVVRFDASSQKSDSSNNDQMIMGPVDIPDASGVLPAAYIDSADTGLGKMFAQACVKGNVKVKVVLVRSSIKPDAGDGEIDAKRLSDWVSTDVVYKNPHPKC